MNRRDFFRKSGRIGILAMMGGGVLLLTKQKQIDWKCDENLSCKGCVEFASCDLEQAKQNRTNEQREATK